MKPLLALTVLTNLILATSVGFARADAGASSGGDAEQARVERGQAAFERSRSWSSSKSSGSGGSSIAARTRTGI